MPSYYYACECGQLTEVEPSRAGTAFSCLCGRESILPSLRHLVRKDMASWNPASRQLEGRSGIEIHTQINRFKLKVYCRPWVVINGKVQQVSWGKSYFPLPPGRYHVEVYITWLLFKRGKSQIQVQVESERIPTLDYTATGFIVRIEGDLQQRPCIN